MLNHKYFVATTLLAALSLSTAEAAQMKVSKPGHFGWQAYAAAEFGGDEIARVFFTNGKSQSIDAGQGFEAGAGGHYRFASSGFDLSGTVGFKYVTTAANNANISVNRMVLEFLGTYFINDAFWLSAGPVLHKSIKYSGDGFTPDINFDDANGFAFKAGYRWFGVQYTNMEYSASFPFQGKVDASNIGIVAVGRF